MTEKIIKSKFWILIAVLLFGGVFINWFEQRGEASVERKSLREFPAKLGEWQQKGGEILFGEQIEHSIFTPVSWQLINFNSFHKSFSIVALETAGLDVNGSIPNAG